MNTKYVLPSDTHKTILMVIYKIEIQKLCASKSSKSEYASKRTAVISAIPNQQASPFLPCLHPPSSIYNRFSKTHDLCHSQDLTPRTSHRIAITLLNLDH